MKLSKFIVCTAAVLLAASMAFAATVDFGVFAASSNPVVEKADDSLGVGYTGHIAAGVFDMELYGTLNARIATEENGYPDDFMGLDFTGISALPMAGFGYTFDGSYRINLMAGLGFTVNGGDVISLGYLKNLVKSSPIYCQAGFTWYPKKAPLFIGGFLQAHTEGTIGEIKSTGDTKLLGLSNDFVVGAKAGISF